MELIWHGTAAVELRHEAGRILFDPFFPLPGAENKVAEDEFDGFSDIFITHGHFDHIASLPEIVRRNPDVRIFCTASPYMTLQKKGISKNNLVSVNPGFELECQGFQISTLLGKHAVLQKATPRKILSVLRSPFRGNLKYLLKEHPRCRENGETLFYRICAGGKELFLLGSLNLRDDIDYPSGCDALILPYNGWNDNLPPAGEVITRLAPKRVLLDHYDNTFPPFTEPLDLSPVLRKFPDLVRPLMPREVVAI